MEPKIQDLLVIWIGHYYHQTAFLTQAGCKLLLIISNLGGKKLVADIERTVVIYRDPAPARHWLGLNIKKSKNKTDSTPEH